VTKKSQKIAIIGAGIVGVSTAIWLQRAGHEVVLIDREGVASGTSYGNAGILACSGIIPVTTPGLVLKAPKMLFDPNQPLFLRWSYLPKILPWLVGFLRKANLKDMKNITSKLHMVMHDSVDQHKALAKGTSAEKYIITKGLLHVYNKKSDFEKDNLAWETLKKTGLEFVEVDAAGIEEYDPSLKNKFEYGILSRSDGHITDPSTYINALAKHFEEQGGKIIIGEAHNMLMQGNAVAAVEIKNGEAIKADHVVLTAGVWSGELAKKLGLDVPLESERGYHLEFINSNIELKYPLMIKSGKFGMNSMNGRLRCAGIVELGGLDAEPSRAPFELLKRQVKELFPELEYDEIKEWMGHRPSTTDSLPLIGALEKTPNVWAGFGHQHLGLTGGPRTGKWLAQMISGEKPNEDLSAFAPNRFE